MHHQQKEINYSRHLFFPFATKTLNDLLSFSTYLLDDNNNQIIFAETEKKKKRKKTYLEL